MKILFIDTVHPYLWNSLQEAGHECVEGYTLSRDELMQQVSFYDGLVIRSRIQLDKEILSAAHRLRFIARAGAGMESIDVECAQSKNIACLNSPEGNRDAVGEHAVGMLLSLMNNLNKADREVRNGSWEREGNRGHELGGKTVGIIGYGNMGTAFASKLKGFSCRVLAYDKYKSGFGGDGVEEVSLETLQAHSDILSLHIPLTAETDGWIDYKFISSFKKNIYLLNTARGKCLKTDDLVQCIKEGKVLGACLDVLEYEDTSFEKFRIRNAQFEQSETWHYLIHSDRVQLSPHIGGWTYESHEKISKILFEKIMKCQ
ncbi:MAG TPA: 2-hydroxyacid dehydrogenase [Bacteroidia bacterium]|nr:2-hydroxyacid dehydrogenase [Bacteroidia bacterium]HNP98390.1 2-hydroxyacid dehydrogenase [Bacteroidia bacterium]